MGSFIMALLMAIGTGVALTASVLRLRRQRDDNTIERWLAAAIPLIALVVGALFVHELLSSLYRSWNDVRLAPAAALLRGYELYYMPGDGPILSFDKGPLTALVYLPAVLWPRPDVAVILGFLITAALYFLPVLVLLRFEAGADRAFPAMCFLVFFLYSVYEPALSGPAFWIHADAPALGFGVLSLALIYTPRRRESTWFQLASASCAVVALGAKQIALPLVVGILIYLTLTSGWRTAWRYARWLGLAAAVGLLGVTLLVDWNAMIFHTITLHASHPWQWGGGAHALGIAFGELIRSALFFITILGVLVLLGRVSGQATTVRAFLRRNPWTLLVIVGLVSLPLALLGRVKVGGAQNNLAYTVYYLTIAALLALLEAGRREAKGTGSLAARACVLVVAGALALATVPGLLGLPALAGDLARNPETAGFAAERDAPGEIYFPFHPLMSIMAEGKAYHASYGLYDLQLAGRPLSTMEFWAHLPPAVRWVAVHGRSHSSLPYLNDYTHMTPHPLLPGWEVFTRPE